MTMLVNSSTSLIPPNNETIDNNDDGSLSRTPSIDYLHVPSFFYSHSRSTPNVAIFFNHQSDHRRLSDGPYSQSFRRTVPYQYHRHPLEFGGSESCMLNRKNSSLNMLLDSTSSLMRTASSTVQCLIGSARRASHCGQPDPSVQLAPNATCGSLYLRSTNANSNDSTLSNTSYDEQRRRVTIYDGRIPTTPVAPTIPFELMTPIEAITHAVDDPVESFVQIVLETPDERPLMLPIRSTTPPSLSPPSVRHQTRSTSPKPTHSQVLPSTDTNGFVKSSAQRSIPTTDIFDANKVHCQAPDVIEPMDFSFLESVLGGGSAPPPPIPPRTYALHSDNEKSRERPSSRTKETKLGIHVSSQSLSSSNGFNHVDDHSDSPT